MKSNIIFKIEGAEQLKSAFKNLGEQPGIVKSKKRPRITRTRWFWLLCGLCWGLTPYIFLMADVGRGYNAIGGEIIFPVIPYFVWAIRECLFDGSFERHKKRVLRSTAKGPSRDCGM